MNKWLVPVTIAMVVGSSGIQAAGDAAAGKTKSATCVACHGPDGNSVNPIWPKLAGQHPEYIEKQLGNFKSGARSDPLMSAQAAPLSSQDMENLAAFFSSQKIKPGTAAADKVAMGERLYRGGNRSTGVAACAACHGPTGSGNPTARFPALAGQHADYVGKALKAFRVATRTNDPASMMQNVASNMSDAEIDAVAQYIQGLQK